MLKTVNEVLGNMTFELSDALIKIYAMFDEIESNFGKLKNKMVRQRELRELYCGLMISLNTFGSCLYLSSNFYLFLGLIMCKRNKLTKSLPLQNMIIFFNYTMTSFI